MTNTCYVNGDSNSAGAELTNSFAFADDDPTIHDNKGPHPDNLLVSYGAVLADHLEMGLVCEAQSASSNERIMRSTVEYLNSVQEMPFIVIGWTSWDREEWDLGGEKYQVSAGGEDLLPNEFTTVYRQWVANQTAEELDRKAEYWHNEIWEFHEMLNRNNVQHLFFNAVSHFDTEVKFDWGDSYFHPYEGDHTFLSYLIDSGYEPNESYHHNANAHAEWADVLLDNINIV